MFISAVTVLGTFIFGVVSDTLGLSISLLISAIVCFSSVMIFYVISQLQQRINVEKQD
jgi:fucose permease